MKPAIARALIILLALLLLTGWSQITVGDGVTVYECDNAVLITQSKTAEGWHIMVFCEDGE